MNAEQNQQQQTVTDNLRELDTTEEVDSINIEIMNRRLSIYCK